MATHNTTLFGATHKITYTLSSVCPCDFLYRHWFGVVRIVHYVYDDYVLQGMYFRFQCDDAWYSIIIV